MAFGRFGSLGTGFGRLGGGERVGGLGGGGLILATETDGWAADFTWPVDAQRVALKTAGAVVSSGMSFFTVTAGSVKWIYNSAGILTSVPATEVAVDYDPVTLVPKGLLWEQSATNLCLQSSDLTNASWVKTTMTTAKTAIGPDAVANSATTITASSANATALQTITSVSAARITGVFLKRRTGSGTIQLTQDNGSTWTTQAVTSSWVRYSLASVTSANPVVGLRLVTSGDAVDVALFQHELGAVITSPIPTTTVTVTRLGGMNRMLPASLNYSATAGSWRMELTYYSSGTGTPRIIGHTNGSHGPFYVASPTIFGMYDGASLNKTVGSVLGSHKLACAFASADRAITADGLAVVTNTAAGTALLSPSTYIGLGGDPAGPGDNIIGHIRKVKYVPRRMSNAELVSETTG